MSVGSFLDRMIQRWAPNHSDAEYDWAVDADQAYIEQNPLYARALLYAIAAVVLVLLLWAAIAEVDQVTRGEAKVIPSSQVQVIQSQDGGVVAEIFVAEGELVEKGQLLIRLDETRFASNYREFQAEFAALSAKAARLRAVANGGEFVPQAWLQAEYSELVEQERAHYQSSVAEQETDQSIARQQLTQREQELNEVKIRREQLQYSYGLAEKELRMTLPLQAAGAVSEVELLRLQREVNDLKGEVGQVAAQVERLGAAVAEARRKPQELELDFVNRARDELSETMTRLNTLQESKAGLSDRVEQTYLRSPVRGTVKQLYFNTVGGVVLPGEEVVDIVPSDDALLLEAKIRPKDIAFLRPGQLARVRFTAYDFVVYGGMDATVRHIAADTIKDENGEPFYVVRVRTEAAKLGGGLPIMPGMVAEVDILTGKKTVLAYLLKPVLRAKLYALSES